MRIAQFIKESLKNEHLILVLPPWGPLYHWRENQAYKIPWTQFFNIHSLNSYLPVIEFEEFLKINGPHIDVVYYLQYPQESLETSEWKETLELNNCTEAIDYEELDDGTFYGSFWGYPEVTAKKLSCVSVLGSSLILKDLLQEKEEWSIMIDRAEVVLHPMYGDANFWKARHSMQFAAPLIEAGNLFRQHFLNSNDESDNTFYPKELSFSQKREALGGPYLALHLRRQDFVHSRPKDTPSLNHAAHQINKKLKELDLKKAFIATDASNSEFEELKKLVPQAIKFEPTQEQIESFGLGGLAIIDQWICGHAKYFIGSYESTFSFRIHEEREILGFPEHTTFNRLCGDGTLKCDQPSIWKLTTT